MAMLTRKAVACKTSSASDTRSLRSVMMPVTLTLVSPLRVLQATLVEAVIDVLLALGPQHELSLLGGLVLGTMSTKSRTSSGASSLVQQIVLRGAVAENSVVDSRSMMR